MHIVSRECIRDTLLAKRDGVLDQCRRLYNYNIRTLRKGQLAPYQEPWHENRILHIQIARKVPTEIIIFVRGGRVEEVYATNPNILIDIADYDCDYDREDHLEWLREAEERVRKPDMHNIY